MVHLCFKYYHSIHSLICQYGTDKTEQILVNSIIYPNKSFDDLFHFNLPLKSNG